MRTFYYNNTNGVITQRSSALDRIGIKHCFTTRFGGISRGDRAYTNMSFSRDVFEVVDENYNRVAKACGFSGKFALTYQTHTDKIRYVSDFEKKYDFSTEPIDALYTDKKGICLVAFTADCTPVLLADKKGRCIGAVHSGWRGTVQKIAPKTVIRMCEDFGCDPSDIVAVIGPHINGCCYEVGSEVKDEFCINGDIYASFFQQRKDKFMLDMAGAIEYMLKEVGVKEIHISPDCTYCRNDAYYSHRRTGDARGNLGAMIEL